MNASTQRKATTVAAAGATPWTLMARLAAVSVLERAVWMGWRGSHVVPGAHF